MSGRIEGVGRRCRTAGGILAVLAALVLALPAVASACIEDGGGEDQPPTIGFAHMSPATLGYHGGTVIVSGEVGDDCGIASVHGEVVGEEQRIEYFEMEPVGPGSFVGTTVYQAEVQLPQNFTEQPVHYLAVMEAEDSSFQVEHAFAGETEVEAQPAFDEPPVVSNAALAPRTLGSAGGAVTIGADAFDNRSVSVVFAIVTLPGGSQQEVALEPVSFSHFEGTFAAPANLGTAAQAYSVIVYAEDDIGQTGSIDAGQVSVAASPPKATGRLAVLPATRNFGGVRVGKSAWRLILVRNTGPRSTAPLEGVIQVSGGPFSLLGTGPEGIHFRLRPGEFRFYAVAFRPTAPGPQSGSVTITRTDGGQPGLAVGLSGGGVPPPPPKCRPSRRCPRERSSEAEVGPRSGDVHGHTRAQALGPMSVRGDQRLHRS